MDARWPGPRFSGVQVNRRGFLRAALGVGGSAVLIGHAGKMMLRLDRGAGADGSIGYELGSTVDQTRPCSDVAPPQPPCADPFSGGELVQTLGFKGEGPMPLDTPLDAGLDGRLYTDLSRLTTDSLVIPNERFFIRTRYPDRLKPSGPWLIRASGLVKQPGNLQLDNLMSRVQPMGTHVLECSGNGGGVLWLAQRVCLGGDPYERGACFTRSPSRRGQGPRLRIRRSFSILGKLHRRSQLDLHPGRAHPRARIPCHAHERRAAAARPRRAGAPLRTRVVWLRMHQVGQRDRLVGENEPATSQMQEFASRTGQASVPVRARDYRAASLDQAAMPLRIEKWRIARDGRLLYRVVGISWGGVRTSDRLTLRFNPSDPFVPVNVCPPHSQNATWTLWSHPWRPAARGTYTLRLRIDDAGVPQHRLGIGFYDRTVAIAEV